MKSNKRCDIMAKAICRYGEDHQKLKCVEECTELSKELIKDMIGEGNREHIVEEMSDLMITIQEMLAVYDVKKEEIESWQEKKLERLEKKIDSEPVIEHAGSTPEMCGRDK